MAGFIKMDNIFDLTGRVALVTGAGRGIGREIAGTLAGAGANIAIAELDPASGEQAAKEIRAIGRDALAVETDVRKPDSVESAVQQTLQKFGKIDILIANAGICVN